MSFLSWRALRSAGAVALLTAVLVMIASAVRLLPLWLDEAVAPATALAFAQILTVPGSQTVLLVALPTGLALLAVDLVASGETRALAALGVSPARMAIATWPAIVLLSLVPIACSLSFGELARSPGRFVTTLLARADAGCDAARPISRVPWVGAVALCEREHRVLALSTEGALLRARHATVALDLRTATLVEARIDLRGPPRVVLRTPSLTVRGAAPFALPQSVHHGVRTGAIIGAAALGGLAAFGVLTMRREARVGAALLVSGALPALATLAFVDARVSAGALAWTAVPLSAMLPAAVFLAWGTGVAARSRPSRDD